MHCRQVVGTSFICGGVRGDPEDLEGGQGSEQRYEEGAHYHGSPSDVASSGVISVLCVSDDRYCGWCTA